MLHAPSVILWLSNTCGFAGSGGGWKPSPGLQPCPVLPRGLGMWVRHPNHNPSSEKCSSALSAHPSGCVYIFLQKVLHGRREEHSAAPLAMRNPKLPSSPPFFSASFYPPLSAGNIYTKHLTSQKPALFFYNPLHYSSPARPKYFSLPCSCFGGCLRDG